MKSRQSPIGTAQLSTIPKNPKLPLDSLIVESDTGDIYIKRHVGWELLPSTSVDTQVDPQEGTNITIDKTNPLQPVISVDSDGVVTNHPISTLAVFGFVVIDFNGSNQVKTIVPIELTYDVEILVVNHEQAETALLDIIVTDTVIVTMPNNSLMQETDPRWNSSTKELTIEGGPGSILELSLSIVNGENKWILSDKFI